jgi:hypothetical protein
MRGEIERGREICPNVREMSVFKSKIWRKFLVVVETIFRIEGYLSAT